MYTYLRSWLFIFKVIHLFDYLNLTFGIRAIKYVVHVLFNLVYVYILLNHVLVRFLINKIEIYCFDSIAF